MVREKRIMGREQESSKGFGGNEEKAEESEKKGMSR